VITDAQDLSTTDFACMVTQNSLSPKLLEAKYNESLKTLSISDFGSAINLHDMKDIYFGDSQKEGNI
jgi:hypothetical protein